MEVARHSSTQLQPHIDIERGVILKTIDGEAPSIISTCREDMYNEHKLLMKRQAHGTPICSLIINNLTFDLQWISLGW